MKKTAFFIVFCLLASSALFSQTVVNMGSQRNLTSCDAIIYDHAGQNGNYVGGREDTLTIYPVAGAVQILFEEMDIAETDTLFIYNGVDPANDSIPLLIGSLSANWVNNSNVIQLGDQMTAATIQNPNGALTLRFVSSANTVGGTGYKLVVTCGQPCQRVHATMDMANMIPTPHFDTELHDGYYYMDFCPGDTLTFSCYGYYPDNDYSYHQSDATTIFEWSMGGDIMRGANMNTVQYAFPPGQGFDVSLTMIDQRSCQAQAPVAIRIRGSRDPLTNVSLLDDVCSGTQIPLVVGYDTSSTIVVEPITSTQTSSLSVDSTVFIPDGPYCSPPCYSSSANFTTFPAGATITRAADILSVCINIEHSYIGDINISLVCPNSRSVLLMPDHNGVNNWAYFGIMYEPDNGCLPANNPQGTGWNYCWSENSAYAQLDGLCYNNVGGNLSQVVDSSNMYTHVGYYTPTQSFSNLVGCPLNGLWSIQVCDTWGSDNGYVFSWELALDPALMPQD
jgi:subtilisin-like proprotein convertase family protein